MSQNLGNTGFLSLSLPSRALNSKINWSSVYYIFLCEEKQSYNNGATVVRLYAKDSPTIGLNMESFVWKNSD